MGPLEGHLVLRAEISALRRDTKACFSFSLHHKTIQQEGDQLSAIQEEEALIRHGISSGTLILDSPTSSKKSLFYCINHLECFCYIASQLRQSTCNILNNKVKKNVLLNEKENTVCSV